MNSFVGITTTGEGIAAYGLPEYEDEFHTAAAISEVIDPVNAIMIKLPITEWPMIRSGLLAENVKVSTFGLE